MIYPMTLTKVKRICPCYGGYPSLREANTLFKFHLNCVEPSDTIWCFPSSTILGWSSTNTNFTSNFHPRCKPSSFSTYSRVSQPISANFLKTVKLNSSTLLWCNWTIIPMLIKRLFKRLNSSVKKFISFKLEAWQSANLQASVSQY